MKDKPLKIHKDKFVKFTIDPPQVKLENPCCFCGKFESEVNAQYCRWCYERIMNEGTGDPRD